MGPFLFSTLRVLLYWIGALILGIFIAFMSRSADADHVFEAGTQMQMLGLKLAEVSRLLRLHKNTKRRQE